MLQEQTKPKLGVIFLIMVLAYCFVETRYPSINYDDTYLLNSIFPSARDMPFFGGGIQRLLYVNNSITNEFRTYGLSKAFHYFLFEIFGTNMLYYYFVMASMTSAAAFFAAYATISFTSSRVTGISVAACSLLGPFVLFQTFHHASYILLPLLVTTAYFALLANGINVTKNTIIGGTLCIIITTIGEVAPIILLVAIIIFFIYSWCIGNKSVLKVLLIHILMILTMLASQYEYYRIVIFNPSLQNRFTGKLPITLDSFQNALVGFNTIIFTRLFSFDALKVLKSNVHIDPLVTVAISISAIAVVIAIIRTTGEPHRSSIWPAIFMIVLYIVSFSMYVFIAARKHVDNYPTRYLHVSGLFFTGSLCLIAAHMPTAIRKTVLISLVCVSSVGGILTFGVKVPTIETFHARISSQVMAAIKQGGTNVNFLSETNDIFCNPYFLAPATSPLMESWITGNYSPIMWGLPRTYKLSSRPGDIEIKATQINEGFLPELSVQLVK